MADGVMQRELPPLWRQPSFKCTIGSVPLKGTGTSPLVSQYDNKNINQIQKPNPRGCKDVKNCTENKEKFGLVSGVL
jgi:hypothetical protein